MKVSHPNLFSYEALTSSSLKFCIWQLALGIWPFGIWLSATAKCFASYGVEIPRLRSGFRRAAQTPRKRLNLSVILPRGFHPFPSRTRKLSPAGPMVLHAKVCGSVGRRRHKIKGHSEKSGWPFLRSLRVSKKSGH